MDKNTIIGFVLILGIMLGFSWYQSKQYKKQVAYQTQLDSVARVEAAARAERDSVKMEQLKSEAQDKGVSVEELQKPVAIYKDSLINEASKAEAAKYTLSNEKVEIVLTTKGAQPYSVRIKDYTTYYGEDLYLIKPEDSQLGVTVYAGENINTKDFNFQIVSSTDSSVVMRLPFAGGGFVEQSYTLPSDSYMLQDKLSFVGMDKVLPQNVRTFDIDWGAMIPRCEKGYKNEKQYSKLDYYFLGDKKPQELGRGRDNEKRIDSRIKWVAFQQQFFSCIFMSQDEFASGNLAISFAKEDDPERKLMTCSARMMEEMDRTAGDIVKNYSFYFGPNHFSTLKSFDQKFEKIIPLGGSLVGWISRFFIIPCFNFLSKYLASYGIIILLMTILLKLVISPLTIKSYMSSAKMNAIKPEIDKLNEKYPRQEDAMKKQQAQMDLYKRAGISPMGGCLPLLFQFPILWAMFRFFPASIELRQQSFLWAEDLSAYDSILDFGFNIPLYGDHVSLFALLMAITMFFYSKMTSSQMSSDPNMAGMKFMSVYLMPIMMLFICNNLSSGLTYYYFLSNLITMLQTWVIKKWFVHPDKIMAQLKANSAKPITKSKWELRLEEARKMQAEKARRKK